MMFGSVFKVLAVEDGHFRVRADALQLGRGLDGHGLAESWRDGAGLLNHRDNGGGFVHADNTAGLAGILDKITGAEGVSVGHNL